MNGGIYHDKMALLINIDHTIRMSRSGSVYICDPNDVGVYSRTIPILRSLRRHGYTLIGISTQQNIETIKPDPAQFENSIHVMNHILGVDCYLDRTFYTFNTTYTFFDKAVIAAALNFLPCHRSHILYVGYMGLEAEICEKMKIPFCNTRDWLDTLVHKRMV